MKLTYQDKQYLARFGVPERDYIQIEQALSFRKTTYILTCGDIEKKIGVKKAVSLLGREKFLSGVHRSAFHYSAVQFLDDSDENKGFVYFDSRKLFNEY